jgi:predicted RNA-binding Zn ribbon-like protein
VSKTPRYHIPKLAPPPLRLVQQFINTVDKEHGRDRLPTPAALHEWLVEHELPLKRSRLRRAELERALAIRDGLRLLVNTHRAAPPRDKHLEILNRAAVEAKLTVRFESDGSAVLAPGATDVAGAIGQLLVIAYVSMLDGSWRRLKSCPNCNWVFYDYSRNHSATWCSMKLCGNRMKTRSYYRRHRSPRPDRRR